MKRYYTWQDANGFWRLVRDVSEAWGFKGAALEIGTVYMDHNAAFVGAQEDADGALEFTTGNTEPPSKGW